MSSILLIHSGPILFSFGRIDLDVSQFYVSLISAMLGVTSRGGGGEPDTSRECFRINKYTG